MRQSQVILEGEVARKEDENLRLKLEQKKMADALNQREASNRLLQQTENILTNQVVSKEAEAQ